MLNSSTQKLADVSLNVVFEKLEIHRSPKSDTNGLLKSVAILRDGIKWVERRPK
jgi:hypothetical protein